MGAGTVIFTRRVVCGGGLTVPHGGLGEGLGCTFGDYARVVDCGSLLGHADCERRSRGSAMMIVRSMSVARVDDSDDSTCTQKFLKTGGMWWREVVARAGAAAEATVYVAAVAWVVVEVKASW